MTNPNEIPCVSREWDRYCEANDTSADDARESAIDDLAEKYEVIIYRKGSAKWSWQLLDESGEILREVKDYYECVEDAASDADSDRRYYADQNTPKDGDDCDGDDGYDNDGEF